MYLYFSISLSDHFFFLFNLMLQTGFFSTKKNYNKVNEKKRDIFRAKKDNGTEIKDV